MLSHHTKMSDTTYHTSIPRGTKHSVRGMFLTQVPEGLLILKTDGDFALIPKGQYNSTLYGPSLSGTTLEFEFDLTNNEHGHVIVSVLPDYPRPTTKDLKKIIHDAMGSYKFY